MTLQSGGTISFSNIANELGGGGNSLNSFGFRRLADVYSGPISLGNFYNRSSIVMQDTPAYRSGDCGRAVAIRIINTYYGVRIRDVALYPNCSGYPGPDPQAWNSSIFADIPLTKGVSVGQTGIVSVYNNDFEFAVSGFTDYSYNGDRILTIIKRLNQYDDNNYYTYVIDLYNKGYTRTDYFYSPPDPIGSVGVGD